MKSENELRQKLASLKADERLSYPCANIQINAPLALEQLAGESKIHTLEWALGLPFSKFPLPKPLPWRFRRPGELLDIANDRGVMSNGDLLPLSKDFLGHAVKRSEAKKFKTQARE